MFKIPVYRGAENTILGRKAISKLRGEDGFGDFISEAPKAKISEASAVNAIHKIVLENPGVSLIFLGPLTNLALALKIYPHLRNNIGHLWIMGGSIGGPGNFGFPNVEFNFSMDPEAAHIVLSSERYPITLLPCDPCRITPFSLDWRFNILGDNPHQCMNLLNTAEERVFKHRRCWYSCDAFLATAFLDPTVMSNMREDHVLVELDGTHTRGQCILLADERNNARVITELDYNTIRKILMYMRGLIKKC